jgi:hypothetical protein
MPGSSGFTTSSALTGNLHDVMLTLTAKTKTKTTTVHQAPTNAKRRFAALAGSLVSERPCQQRRRQQQLLVDKREETKANVTVEQSESTNTTGIDISLDEYYVQMKHTCQAQQQQTAADHQTAVTELQELRSVYLFGLQQVSALQDLREAPDAILPGNCVEETRTTTTPVVAVDPKTKPVQE